MAKELTTLLEEIDNLAQNSEVTDLVEKTKNIHLFSKNNFRIIGNGYWKSYPKGILHWSTTLKFTDSYFGWNLWKLMELL